VKTAARYQAWLFRFVCLFLRQALHLYFHRFAQHKKMRIRQSAGCTGTLFQVTVTLPVTIFTIRIVPFQRGAKEE